MKGRKKDVADHTKKAMTMINETMNTFAEFPQRSASALTGAVLMLATLGSLLGALPAAAGNHAQLADTVRQAMAGDRSDACLAVAGVDGEDVEEAYVCADDDGASRIRPAAGFEIRSVTKATAAT